jgi:5-(carboxyamino)imidazole ribonucleotide synthase
VDDRAGLETALDTIGAPAILKTRRFGYDGKGQARIADTGGAAVAWEEIGDAPSVLEGFIAFEAEFSILLCRGQDGETMVWDSPVNEHEDGILARSTVPAGPHFAGQVEQAGVLARRAADSLGHVGMLTMEFFATPEGSIFNEMAPRVHNSGHWTIEGALTSQFENHIRAICGLPLGATDLVVPMVEMRNLIGSDVDGWAELLADPRNHLHLYGKGEGRPGRKMGHVTRLGTGD